LQPSLLVHNGLDHGLRELASFATARRAHFPLLLSGLIMEPFDRAYQAGSS
jgi:hypothetical protein